MKVAILIAQIACLLIEIHGLKSHHHTLLKLIPCDRADWSRVFDLLDLTQNSRVQLLVLRLKGGVGEAASLATKGVGRGRIRLVVH